MNQHGNSPCARSGTGQSGNSFANGDVLPSWVGWELREVLESRFCSWTVMA